jgi:hypothetical protein
VSRLLLDFVYFNYYSEDNWYDDRQFDHHLGDLPGTGSNCPNKELDNKAAVTVTINGNETTKEWLYPAFMPFKIPYFEKVYPLSTDGLIEDNKEGDNIEYLGGITNNFLYKTYLISVQVTKDDIGRDDNEDEQYNCDEDGKSAKCKQNNGLCEEREVTFTYEFYKTKDDASESLELDYTDIENICKDITI